MKIVVVSMIKNEEVYIESSIRYWFTFADQIILFDHDSKDGTMPIVRDLIIEFGENLLLFNDRFTMGLEYKQAAVTNAMVDTAFRQCGADLVIPLDADEFPYLNKAGSLRDFLSNLPQSSCYTAFWMPFAPPAGEMIDPSVFVPMAFVRKKCKPMNDWGKTIVTRECYYQYMPVLSIGNHTFIEKADGLTPPRVNLSPQLYYAHYACRGKSHYIIKNLHGWLAVYSDINWMPGTALHYQLACEQIGNGAVTDQIVDWYCLSSSGMTGESVEDIQNAIETIDPRSIYPNISIKYTQKHIANKTEIVLLFESAIRLAEQYRDKCKVEKAIQEEKEAQDYKLIKTNEEIQTLKLELNQIKASKAFKLGTCLAMPVRLVRRFLTRQKN